MPRKKTAIITFFITILCSLILIFFNSSCPENQKFCLTGIIELIIIFIFRFSISLEFAFFLVYVNELYPTQIRGMGMGVSSAFGTIASSGIPYFIGEIHSQWIVMLIFMIMAIACLGMTLYLP